MKQLFTTATALLAIFTAALAQTPIANGDFETWGTVTQPAPPAGNGNYPDLSGTFLKTLNKLHELPSAIGGPGPLTVTQVNDVCGGLSAAKVTSSGFLEAPNRIFIPGAVGTFDVSLSPPGIKLGKPYTSRPAKVKYCAKYTSVAGDSAEVFCRLTKWENGQRTTIGFGNLKHYTSSQSYAPYEFTITYSSQATPDSVAILAVSSAGYDFVDLLNSKGQEGSALYIDDLAFDFTIGVEENIAAQTKIYPVPFTNEVNIQLPEGVKATGYKMIDITGRTVASGSFTNTNTVITTANLPQGSYWVELSGAKGILTRRQIQKF